MLLASTLCWCCCFENLLELPLPLPVSVCCLPAPATFLTATLLGIQDKNSKYLWRCSAKLSREPGAGSRSSKEATWKLVETICPASERVSYPLNFWSGILALPETLLRSANEWSVVFNFHARPKKRSPSGRAWVCGCVLWTNFCDTSMCVCRICSIEVYKCIRAAKRGHGVGVAPHVAGSGNGNLKFMHKLQFNWQTST